MPEVTVAVTSTIPLSSKDDPHRAAVETVLQDLAQRYICFIDININITASKRFPNKTSTLLIILIDR